MINNFQKNKYISSFIFLILSTLNNHMFAMELQSNDAVSSLKALSIYAYLKNKPNNELSLKEIDELKVPTEIQDFFKCYQPLSNDTIEVQLECFAQLNDTKMLPKALTYYINYTLQKETTKKQIEDLTTGFRGPSADTPLFEQRHGWNNQLDNHYNSLVQQRQMKYGKIGKEIAKAFDEHKQQYIEDRKKNLNRGFRCLTCAIVGLCVGCVSLIPAAIYIANYKDDFDFNINLNDRQRLYILAGMSGLQLFIMRCLR